MKKVVITAGHSNTDPGAVNSTTKESVLMVNLRNAVAYYLQKDGITVLTDGKGAVNQNLSEAIKLISGSNLAIELHMNASSNTQANGVETISLPKNKKISQDLSAAVAKVLGSRLRGENGWIDQSQSARGKLGFVSAGGIIIEVEFISNNEKLKAFNEKYWLVARAIADVIKEYLK